MPLATADLVPVIVGWMYVALDTSHAPVASVIERFVSFVGESELWLFAQVAYAPGQAPQYGVHLDTITPDQQWSVIVAALRNPQGQDELNITLEFGGEPALVDGRPALANYSCESVHIQHRHGSTTLGHNELWNCYLAFLSLPTPPRPGSPVHAEANVHAATPGTSVRPEVLLPCDAFECAPSGTTTLDHYGPMIYLDPAQLAVLGGLDSIQEAFPACAIADLSHISDGHGAAFRLLRRYGRIHDELLEQWREFLTPVLMPLGELSEVVRGWSLITDSVVAMFKQYETRLDTFMTRADHERLEAIPAGHRSSSDTRSELVRRGGFPQGWWDIHRGVTRRVNSMFYWFPELEHSPVDMPWGSDASLLPSTRGLVLTSTGDLSRHIAPCLEVGPFVAWRRLKFNKRGRAMYRWHASFWAQGEEVVRIEVDARGRGKPTIASAESVVAFNELIVGLGLAEEIVLEPDRWGSLAESRLDVERLIGLVHRRPTSVEVREFLMRRHELIHAAMHRKTSGQAERS